MLLCGGNECDQDKPTPSRQPLPPSSGAFRQIRHVWNENMLVTDVVIYIVAEC